MHAEPYNLRKTAMNKDIRHLVSFKGGIMLTRKIPIPDIATPRVVSSFGDNAENNCPEMMHTTRTFPSCDMTFNAPGIIDP
jgi:hypothetical protein